jgi:hypothetical protein
MSAIKMVVLAAGLVGLALTESVVLKGSGWRAGLDGDGFAVVELFTSEGCSSCPPADELIARTQREDKDLPVYILAFHVDYWDRQGWKDVFSNAAFTDRQRVYAQWFRLSSVYTPEVVVNGRKEFVGSDAASLRGAIREGLQQTGGVTLALSGLRLNGGRLDWQYKLAGIGSAGAREHLSLVAAVVEGNAVTKVKGGENSGRTLSHVQIVRTIRSQLLDGKNAGSGFLDWPAGMNAGEGEVIAFLQDQEDGRIIAATRAKP